MFPCAPGAFGDDARPATHVWTYSGPPPISLWGSPQASSGPFMGLIHGGVVKRLAVAPHSGSATL